MRRFFLFFATLSLLIACGPKGPLTPPPPPGSECEPHVPAQTGNQPWLHARYSIPAEDTYRPGEQASVDVSFTLIDPNKILQTGVLFLNIVENNPDAGFPQAADRIFTQESGAQNPEIFNRAFAGDVFRNCIRTRLNFTFKQDAQPGDYAIAFQLFRGTNTDPRTVEPSQRVSATFVEFSVVP